MIYILHTNTCFGLACFVSDLNSYNKIYEIKKRELKKPIALMVEDFFYFYKNTKLTIKQINFLKKYNKPWTILIDKKKILDNNLLKNIRKLNNSEIYTKLAFRIAHNSIQSKLIKSNGNLFLTSANITGDSEIFDTFIIKKEFGDFIKKGEINFPYNFDFCINTIKKSSDIFEFEGESTKIRYFRK